MSRPVFQVIRQRTEEDCAIAAVAMLTGRSYEDVLVAASALDTKAHRRGLYTTQIKRLSKALGTPLRRVVAAEVLDDAEGLLEIKRRGAAQSDHVVFFSHGLIFDGDGTVHEPDAYTASGHQIVALLIPVHA